MPRPIWPAPTMAIVLTFSSFKAVVSSGHLFHDYRQCLSASDTETGQPPSGAVRFHSVDKCRQNSRAGSAEHLVHLFGPHMNPLQCLGNRDASQLGRGYGAECTIETPHWRAHGAHDDCLLYPAHRIGSQWLSSR